MTGKQTLLFAGMTILAFTFTKRLMAADNSTTLQPVPSIDLNRYAGKWYEIARLPNSFQKSCGSSCSFEMSDIRLYRTERNRCLWKIEAGEDVSNTLNFYDIAHLCGSAVALDQAGR